APSLQTLNSLIFKEFSLSAVGVVRIIETSATASTPIFSLLSKRTFETGSAFPKLPHEPVEPEAQRGIKPRSSPWQTIRHPLSNYKRKNRAGTEHQGR
ncbi:hypothetical protein R0G64_27810, partial [Pseudomonas otitidis]